MSRPPWASTYTRSYYPHHALTQRCGLRIASRIHRVNGHLPAKANLNNISVSLREATARRHVPRSTCHATIRAQGHESTVPRSIADAEK